MFILKSLDIQGFFFISSEGKSNCKDKKDPPRIVFSVSLLYLLAYFLFYLNCPWLQNDESVNKLKLCWWKYLTLELNKK